jgi:hypothetical protein
VTPKWCVLVFYQQRQKNEKKTVQNPTALPKSFSVISKIQQQQKKKQVKTKKFHLILPLHLYNKIASNKKFLMSFEIWITVMSKKKK